MRSKSLIYLLLIAFSASAANARAGSETDTTVQPKTKNAAPKAPPKNLISQATQNQRRAELINGLSWRADKERVKKIFSDSRLALYVPKTPPPEHPKKPPKGNPYLSPDYGLTSPISLERGRFYDFEHQLAFIAAEAKYGVNKWDILGHLRVETRFGIATEKNPLPFGSIPIVNSLYSLYIRRPKEKTRKFAFEQLVCLMDISDEISPDIYEVLGSTTGAFGIPQFEPCSYRTFGDDGNGDGKVDLFNHDDAIMSIARYLYLHGYNAKNRKLRFYSICSYYGSRDKDGKYPRKVEYYAEAVIAYSEEFKKYIEVNPLDDKKVPNTCIARDQELQNWELLFFSYPFTNVKSITNLPGGSSLS